MRHSFFATALVVCGLNASISHAETSAGQAQQVLTQSAEAQKYTFLLFYREDNPATRAMAETLKMGVAKRADRATLCYVSVTDPAEQAVVKRFGVSRAPLPFALAVAPNGAITGLFSQKLADANLDGAFVTPGMAQCMKSMQDKKLVLVCVHASARATTPTAVKEFQSDPEFKDRVAVISVQAHDPTEAQFLKQMEIVPAKTSGSTIVFLAPPAVLVGKFTSTATKAEMAAALHKAGKCCDDPNCKHGHGPQATKNSNATRN
ncbi:MAG: hypothetical protein AB7L90_22590 [Hyphomicrobiaceae bacterium]